MASAISFAIKAWSSEVGSGTPGTGFRVFFFLAAQAMGLERWVLDQFKVEVVEALVRGVLVGWSSTTSSSLVSESKDAVLARLREER